MTDPSLTAEERDELASAYLDGETTADERAQIEADPEIMAIVEQFRTATTNVGATVVYPEPSQADKRTAIAAALDYFPTPSSEVAQTGELPDGDATEEETDDESHEAAVADDAANDGHRPTGMQSAHTDSATSRPHRPRRSRAGRGARRFEFAQPVLASLAVLIALIGGTFYFASQNDDMDSASDTATEAFDADDSAALAEAAPRQLSDDDDSASDMAEDDMADEATSADMADESDMAEEEGSDMAEEEEAGDDMAEDAADAAAAADEEADFAFDESTGQGGRNPTALPLPERDDYVGDFDDVTELIEAALNNPTEPSDEALPGELCDTAKEALGALSPTRLTATGRVDGWDHILYLVSTADDFDTIAAISIDRCEIETRLVFE